MALARLRKSPPHVRTCADARAVRSDRAPGGDRASPPRRWHTHRHRDGERRVGELSGVVVRDEKPGRLYYGDNLDTVGPNIVRELVGTLAEDPQGRRGMIVITSSFTAETTCDSVICDSVSCAL